MNLKLCYQNLVYVICITGFIAQCYHICQSYFKYETLTDVEIEEPYDIEQPGASVCFRLVDVIDKDKIWKLFKIKYTRPDLDNDLKLQMLKRISNLTIKNLFDVTPEPFDIIRDKRGCIAKKSDSLNMTAYDGIECEKMFDTKKYLHLEFLCYQYFLKINPITSKLRYFDYRLTYIYMSLIFRIFFDLSKIGNIEIMTSYVHGRDTITLYDTMNARVIAANSRLTKGSYFDLSLTYFETSYLMLPSPYDTNCTTYPFHGAHDVYRLSLMNNESIKVMNQVGTESILYMNNMIENIKLIDIHDYNDKNLYDKIKNLRKNYFSLNLKETCEYKYLVTDLKYEINSALSLSVYWPRTPDIKTEYKSKLNIIDFIVYICSTIGIWLGLSCLSLLDLCGKVFCKDKEQAQDKVNIHDRDIRLIKQHMMRLDNRTLRTISMMKNSRA